MTEHPDPLLDTAVLDGVASRPMTELRELRARCVDVETGLSYLRRMVQGSLDIVNREMGRRAGGRGPGELADLVEELPEILGEMPRPAGVGRLSRTLEPTSVDPDLQATYDAIVSDGRLTQLGEVNAVDLAELVDRLTSLEDRISVGRRAYHERIDALNAEIGRRYQSGEANVDDLLRDRP